MARRHLPSSTPATLMWYGMSSNLQANVGLLSTAALLHTMKEEQKKKSAASYLFPLCTLATCSAALLTAVATERCSEARVCDVCDPLTGRSWPSCLQSHSERRDVSQSGDTCGMSCVSVYRPRTRLSVIVSRCLGYIWSWSSSPLACGQRKPVLFRCHHLLFQDK